MRLTPGLRRHRYLLTLLLSAIFACSASPSGSSQGLIETARSAHSFVDSIGVVVHLNRGNSAYSKFDDVIKPRLQELGIHHIRDGVKPGDTATQQKFADLATAGIKSTLVMDPRDQPDPSQAIAIVEALPNAVEAVEGPNEWDVWDDLTYKQKSFPRGVRIFQSELYNAIKSNAATAELNVLSPTVALAHNASELGTVDCDIAAMHSYPGGNPPTEGLDQPWISATEPLCSSQAIIATETGWHNAVSSDSGQPGVSEAAAGKYVPRLCLEYFNRGINRVYINELIDKWEGDDKESHFGLLRWDGSPKPAFVALQNLIALLQEDPNPDFIPGALRYSMAGANGDVHHTLLQKNDGHYLLILWQEVRSFDLSNQSDIAVQPQTVTVKLDTAIAYGSLYSPLQSTSPLEQYTNPSSLDLEVGDAPVVLALFPR